MNQAQLCKWLRDNSSGIYRPAVDAAAEIEQLQSRLNGAISALKDFRDYVPPKDWKSYWQDVLNANGAWEDKRSNGKSDRLAEDKQEEQK
jgi:hypothetical protein